MVPVFVYLLLGLYINIQPFQLLLVFLFQAVLSITNFKSLVKSHELGIYKLKILDFQDNLGGKDMYNMD